MAGLIRTRFPRPSPMPGPGLSLPTDATERRVSAGCRVHAARRQEYAWRDKACRSKDAGAEAGRTGLHASGPKLEREVHRERDQQEGEDLDDVVDIEVNPAGRWRCRRRRRRWRVAQRPFGLRQRGLGLLGARLLFEQRLVGSDLGALRLQLAPLLVQARLERLELRSVSGRNLAVAGQRRI